MNDVEVSKGVLGCLNTRHHLDKGQLLTTTDASPLFRLVEHAKGKLEEKSWQEIF